MTPSTILLYGLAAAAFDASATPVVAAPAPEAVAEGQSRTRQKDDEPTQVEGLTIEADPRGKVDSPIPPDFELDEAAIQSLGASNVVDLLTILAPQLESNRGRSSGPPVMLVNGRRISGMQEMQGIPPEAIQRFQVFPEEVALSYGFKADQRVVNIILKKNFNSKMAQAGVTVATDGGYVAPSAGGNRLKIDGDRRWNVDVQVNHSPYLMETERDIVRDPNGQPVDLTGDTGALTAARSLLGKSDKLILRGGTTRDLGKETQLTVSGNVEDTHTEALLGLPGVAFTLPAGGPFSPSANAVTGYRYIDAPGALAREADILRTQLAMIVSGRLGGWRWTAAGDFDRSVSDTTTGRGLDASAFQAAVAAGDPAVNPFGVIPSALYRAVAPDTAHSVSTSASASVVLNGAVFEAPAGPVQSSFRIALDTRGLDSKTVRSGVTTERDVSRDRQSVMANLNLPLTSTRQGFLAKAGDLSANVNFEYEDLSDLGGLTTLGGGLVWTPVKTLNFAVNYAQEEGAPTTNQINDPILVTPNYSAFDFNTGQTVLISYTVGGNPALRNDSRAMTSFSGTYKPFAKIDLTLNATYTRSEIKNQITSFPTITPDLEAAFPERFTRDAGGRLLAIDARPINIASADSEKIRWGLNFSMAVGTPIAAPAGPGGPGGPGAGPGGPGGGMMRFGPPPGASGGGAPGGGGPGGGGPGGGGLGPGAMPKPGQGLLRFSIYHTWRLSDEITIRKGLPVLDQLDGAAISSRNGGARHEIQAQGGYSRNGLGVNLNATWKDSTWVNGGATGGQTLYFSDLAMVGVNAFANLNASQKALVAKYPLLKNGFVMLNVDNLFNARQTVRDQSGVTPQAYQRDYLDPLGRTVRISFRKLLY